MPVCRYQRSPIRAARKQSSAARRASPRTAPPPPGLARPFGSAHRCGSPPGRCRSRSPGWPARRSRPAGREARGWERGAEQAPARPQAPPPPRHLEGRFQLVHQRVVGIAGPRRRRDEAGRAGPAGWSGRRGSRRLVGEHPAQRARHATRLPAAGPRMRAAADGGGGRLLRGVSSAPGGDRREQRQKAGLPRGSPHPQPYLPSSTGKQRLFRHFPAFVFWFLADWTSPVLETKTPVLHGAQSVWHTAGAADIALRAMEKQRSRTGVRLGTAPLPPPTRSLTQNTLCKIYWSQELCLLYTWSSSFGHSLVLNTSGMSNTVFLF